MVTSDEIDPLNLRLRCSVNDKVVQDANTDDFLFTPGEVASYVSTFITLEPCDLFLTGTPSGVGLFRKPPVFLAPGDVMRTEIAGIGELVNRCVGAD
jgi:acylpyruvate hydrolase